MVTADLVLKIGQVILTVLVALLAGLIASRQANTAQAKLKLDLYDRRFDVYRYLMEFVDALQSRAVPDDEYATLVNKLNQTQFLFGKELRDWMVVLLRDARLMNNARWTTYRAGNGNPDGIPHEEVVEAGKTYSQLTLRFDGQMGIAGEMFGKYLDFSKNL